MDSTPNELAAGDAPYDKLRTIYINKAPVERVCPPGEVYLPCGCSIDGTTKCSQWPDGPDCKGGDPKACRANSVAKALAESPSHQSDGAC